VAFTREEHEWEVGVFASFLQVFHSVTMRRGAKDKLWGVSSKRGMFKVKSFFCSLACSEGSRFPWKSVLWTQAPSREAFFTWSSGTPMSATVWKLVPTCLFLTIWREMNNMSFEDLERSLEDILSSFFHTSYLWTAAFVSSQTNSYYDILVRFSLSS
jgi:hypothetical protein